MTVSMRYLRSTCLRNVWSRANFTDRMYLALFSGIGILVPLLRHRVPGWPPLLALDLSCLGIVLLLVVCAQHFPTAHAWYPLAMPIVSFVMIAHLDFLVVDTWRDHYLLTFESWLFPLPPTVWLAQHQSPLLTEILQIGYFSYFALLAIVAAMLYRSAGKVPLAGVMAASTLGYMLCYAIFVMFPTEGPAHTLRHLHGAPLRGGLFHWLVNSLQHGGVHGNAFPSAHVVGTVVPLFFAWRHVPKLAAWLTPLVVLGCVGAVYDRYHYVSDILAGIAIGAASAYFVMFAQARPNWARCLNINSI